MKLASAAILLSIVSPLASAASHSGVDPSIEAILTKIEEGDAHRRTLLAKVDTLSDKLDSLDKINLGNHKKGGLRNRRTQGMVPQGMVLAEVLHKVNKLEELANCIGYNPDYDGYGHSACLVGSEDVSKVIFSAYKVKHFADDIVLKGDDSIDIRAASSSIDIKAWGDDVEITASDDVKIVASDDEVSIKAKGPWGSVDIEGNDSVDITADQSSVDLEASSDDVKIYASEDINIEGGGIDIEAEGYGYQADIEISADNDVNIIAKSSSLDIKPNGGMSISASKDINIKGGGSMDFKASDSIDLEASQSVDIVAANSSVDIKGKGGDGSIDAAGSVIVQGYHVYPQLGFSDYNDNSAPASGAEAPANEDTDASYDEPLTSLDEGEVPEEEEVPESAESVSINSIASASSEDTVSGDTKIVAAANSSSEDDDVDDEPEPQSEAEADAKTSAD